MKRCFTLLVLLAPLFAISQEYWRYYDFPQLPDPEVMALAVEGPDLVWIGTQSGLSKFDNGQFTHFDEASSDLVSNNIRDLEVVNGVLWIATNLGLAKLDGSTFTTYTTADGLISDDIYALDVDQAGNIWVGTNQGISTYDGTTFANDNTFAAYDLAIDDADNVWIRDNDIAFISSGSSLHRYDGSSWTSIPTTDFSQTVLLAGKLHCAGTDLYIGTGNAGYFHFDGTTWTNTSLNEGLIDDFVAAVTVDGNGEVWATQESGLAQSTGTGIAIHNLFVQDVDPTCIVAAFDRIYMGTWNGFFWAEQAVAPLEIHQELDVNNIRAGFNASNRMFTAPYETFDEAFEVGPGSGITGMFFSNLWISAEDGGGNTRVAAQGYEGHDLFAGPSNDDFAIYRNPILKVSRQMIDDHIANYNQPGYVMPTAILEWPANGNPDLGEPLENARFVDVTNNGYYDPHGGDYPAILGDQAVFITLNDQRFEHSGSGSLPIGLDVYIMAYGYSDPQNAGIDNTVFFDIELVNRSNTDYTAVKAGIFADFQLGQTQDDYVGSDSASSTFFVYNADNDDQDDFGQLGFGLNPPVIGYRFLEPRLDHFQFFNNFGNPNTSMPQNAQSFANFLDAKWMDGSPIVDDGGDGYDPGSTDLERYMFNGDPVTNTGWTEANAGNAGGDRRGFGSFPAAPLNAGERVRLHAALGVARGDGLDHLENIDFFKSQMGDVQTFFDAQNIDEGIVAYETHPMFLSNESPVNEASQVIMYPNPSRGALSIRSGEQLQSLTLTGLDGRVVGSFPVNGLYTYSVNLPEMYPSGIYLVEWTTTSGEHGVEKLMLAR